MSVTPSIRRLVQLLGALLVTLVVLSFLLVAPLPVQAATLVVTKGMDTDDGTCNADCSLREAIIAASAGDTITFANDVATVTLTSAQLTIDKDLTIDGDTGVTIQRDAGTTTEFRIFAVTGSDTEVTLDSLTITNGFATGTFPENNGGGIFNEGTLEIISSTLAGNEAGFGGGIYNNGTLTVTSSTFSGNSASSGGGIFNNIGTLTVTSSTFSGNTASDDGGAISNVLRPLEIVNSTLSGNEAELGGGIFNGGTLTVINSTLSGNEAELGGGIYNGRLFTNIFGTLEIANSTLTGNSASSGGGGIFNEGNSDMTVTDSTLTGNSASSGGGGIFNEGTVTVTSSTLSGNRVAGSGGGIFNGGTLTVTSSTLSGNRVAGFGGGILNNAGTLTVTSSTLSGNSARPIGGSGGIRNSNGTLTLANTIVAGSTDGEGSATNDYRETGDSVVFNAEGVNIVETYDTITITPGGDGTIISGDPLLGPLQDNGGPTLTHLPQGGSPAIDAGDNAALSESTLGYDTNGDGDQDDTLDSDQRGFARIVNTTVDIGAVEVGAGDITYNISIGTDSTAEGTSGATTDVTVTVTRSGATTDASSVDVMMGGTATEGASADYTFGLASGSAGSFDGTTLTFSADETEATFTLTVQGDDEGENDEIVNVRLSNATALETPTISTVEVNLTIQDDDSASSTDPIIYLPLIAQ
jgi:CSLREA domain-containing protein